MSEHYLIGHFRKETATCDFDVADFDPMNFSVYGSGWQGHFNPNKIIGSFRKQ